LGRAYRFFGVHSLESSEIRLAVIGVLLPSVFILGFSSLAAVLPVGLKSLSHSGPHGLTEILYAFASGAGNNGSAFGGLNANTPFYNFSLSISMLIGRFGVIVPVLGLAGLLSRKTPVPESAGTFPVTGALFGVLLMGAVVIVGALTFFPSLALGPILEHLQFVAR
jgi:K+-transporting ATPase ATPase A chain